MATLRIDDQLKKEADAMFDEVGMNTSQAVRIFLTRFVRTGKFPFEIEVSSSYTPNQETMEAFEETSQMIKNGETGKKYDSAKSFLASVLEEE